MGFTPRPRIVTLADVDPAGLVDGDTLLWDAAAGEWRPGPAGGGAKGGDLVVAASDSPQFLKDRADYVCDGAGDQVEIQAALNACAGTVWLAGGTYSIDVGPSYGIRVWGKALRGLAAPWSQIAVLEWASGTAGPLVELNAGTVSDLALYVEGTNAIFPKGKGSRVERCYIQVGAAPGHGIAGSWVTTALTVVGCQFYAPAGCRWINLTGSPTGLTIDGCWDDGGGGGGINIAANLVRGRIEGNRMFTGDAGIVVAGGVSSAIVGNAVLGASDGSGITVAGTNMVVTHNRIDDPAFHGIHVLNGIDCLVADNIVNRASYSANNAYDGIIVDGATSSRVAVLRNLIRGNNVSPKPRYGINVAAGSDAIVVENDIRPAANFATGPYGDAGTGTVKTHAAHATYGDNWT